MADDGAGISLLEGLATTRAIRRFLPDAIPEEDLASILWHATRAPSGSNRQPARFLVLRDGPAATEARALLGQTFRAMWGAKRAEEGYDRGSGVDEDSPKARMARTMQHFVDHFEETPVVILACNLRYREAHVSEGGSVYPQCQNLLLAARALGYGGVITMWHGVRRGRPPAHPRAPRRRGHRRHGRARTAPGTPRTGAPPAARRGRLRGPVWADRGLGSGPAGHAPQRRTAARIGLIAPRVVGNRWTTDR